MVIRARALDDSDEIATPRMPSGIVPAKAASATFLRALLAGLESAGADPAELARRFPRAEAEDPEARVPVRPMLEAWRDAEALTGDGFFGLHLAMSTAIGAYGVLDFVTRSASTIGEGLDETVRWFRLLSDVCDLALERTATGTRLVQTVDEDAVDLRHAAECLFATIIARARAVTGMHVVPRFVGFHHARPAEVHELVHFFGCEVRFGQPHNELALDDAVLALPLVTHDAGLHAVLSRHAGSLVAQLVPERSFVDRARTATAAALESGAPTLAEVARRLGASPRTVQRRLQEAGTTFEAILDPARRDLALRHLRQDALGIGQIAFAVGFAEPSAFYRAFRRWTGMTPGAYRARRSTASKLGA